MDEAWEYNCGMWKRGKGRWDAVDEPVKKWQSGDGLAAVKARELKLLFDHCYQGTLQVVADNETGCSVVDSLLSRAQVAQSRIPDG